MDSLCLLYSQIDDRQKVIAGHGRLLAARKMGWDKVTAIQLSHLTESQHMACQRTLRAKRKEGDSRKGEVDIGKCEAFKTTGQRNFSLLLKRVGNHAGFAATRGKGEECTVTAVDRWQQREFRRYRGAIECDRLGGVALRQRRTTPGCGR